MVNKKVIHKRAKTSFNEEDIKYMEDLMKENKSAELALLYIKVTKAKKQQEKNRESSRLSKKKQKELFKIG